MKVLIIGGVAGGASPIRPNLPGIDNDKIFLLRTVEDTYDIREYVENNNPQSAVIVGGGFIGIEMAENLSNMGIKVTVVERDSHVIGILDYDMAAMIHSKLRTKGVELKLETSVIGFEETNSELKVNLQNNESLDTDMVLMCIGVAPESTLDKDAGLELGIRDAIVVNDKMETSAKDIYAVGDAVQVKHIITGDNAVISLAGPANKQGRIVANNICGIKSHYKGSMGSSVIKVYDMTAASTGLTEKMLKNTGINYERVVLSPLSHAGYYPGGKVMTMKVIFDMDSLRILSAQIVGYDGVDKRIDVIATAISAGMKADELSDLDLAYAPPYSSAKDPVNMAGFMIDNIANGVVKQFHYDEIDKIINKKDVILLDTRTSREYERGHVEGFINIPVDDLRNRLNELDKSKTVYVMCQSGLRSYIGCRVLSQNGYDCYNFSGGYRFYNIVMKEKTLVKDAFPCGMDK